jgi:AmmeMemoRadiSam system protein B
MITAMLAAQRLGATGARVLNYANSGDVTGDRGQVVGYMAAALFAPAKQGDKE